MFPVFGFPFQLDVLINTEIFLLQVILLNQVTTKYSEGSFQLTLALGMFQTNVYARLLCICFLMLSIIHVEQVIVGHMHAQIESFCTGMGMNGMHLLTNLHQFDQHHLPIL